MQCEPPHDIFDLDDIPFEKKPQFIPLTPEEAELLKDATEEGRALWFARNVTSIERLARFLEHEDMASMAYNARQGRYPSNAEGRAAFIESLKVHGRHDIVKQVLKGQWDICWRPSDGA